jgi:formamidopyrimidine-DNA glycosylase
VPELPEVETIRRRLAPRVEGRRMVAVEVLDPRWCAPAGARDTEAALAGRRVEQLGRRGKYLIWALEGDRALVMHLRMTGTVLARGAGGATPPHTRVRLGLDDGDEVVFVDPRRFGTGHVLDGAALDEYLDARLGLEPFHPRFTPDHLRALAHRCRAPVKAFLLDQRRIAGVGNIYADEALFRAQIHPLREAGKLSRAQISALAVAVQDALAAGIAAGGATIDDFRGPDGERGGFQDEFLVHRRAGEPCPRCGTTVRKLVAAGRGTYVCERCQPRPRARRRAAAEVR